MSFYLETFVAGGYAHYFGHEVFMKLVPKRWWPFTNNDFGGIQRTELCFSKNHFVEIQPVTRGSPTHLASFRKRVCETGAKFFFFVVIFVKLKDLDI